MANQPTTHRSPIGLYLRSPLGVRSGNPDFNVVVADGISGHNTQGSADALSWKLGSAVNGALSVVWSSNLKLWVFANQGAFSVAIASSTNGKTWTSRVVSRNYQSICFAPVSLTFPTGLFCAVGSGDTSGTLGLGAAITSPDALVWTKQVGPHGGLLGSGGPAWRGVCFDITHGTFCAVTFSSGRGFVMTSSDSITWANPTLSSPLSTYAWSCVAADGGVICAGENTGNNTIMRSTDGGATWAGVTTPAGHWQAICNNGAGVWVAVGDGTNKVIMSTDAGLTWVAQTPAVSENFYGVCWSPMFNKFIAVSQAGTFGVMTTPDLTSPQTWSTGQMVSPSGAFFAGVASK